MFLTIALIAAAVFLVGMIAKTGKKKPVAGQPSWMPEQLLANLQASQQPAQQLTARQQDEAAAMNVVQAWYQTKKKEKFEKEVLTELSDLINTQSL